MLHLLSFHLTAAHLPPFHSELLDHNRHLTPQDQSQINSITALRDSLNAAQLQSTINRNQIQWDNFLISIFESSRYLLPLPEDFSHNEPYCSLPSTFSDPPITSNTFNTLARALSPHLSADNYNEDTPADLYNPDCYEDFDDGEDYDDGDEECDDGNYLDYS